MSFQEEFFGFSKKQIKALWALSAIAVVLSVFWMIAEYSSDSAETEGLTIYVGGSDQTYQPVFVIDLNHSPADSMELIPGIGPVFSERIVAFRDSSGGFKYVECITQVRGIGQSLLQRIKPYLKVTP